MNDADWDTLGGHIKTLLGELHLSDWTIHLLRDPCDEGCYAVIRPTYGQRSANLNVAADFRDVEAARANKALVHELLHCHAAGVQHHVEDDGFKRLLGDPAYAMWRVGFDQAHENHVDAVARVLAPHMPPLTWVLDSERDG